MTLPPLSEEAVFEASALLGEGTFCSVYGGQLTVGDGPPRRCALKVLKPAFMGQAELMLRLIDEGRLQGVLGGPHFVPAYGEGSVDGSIAVAVEWLEGVDLETLCIERGALSARAALQALRGVAQALHFGREHPVAGLIAHADIKPANIWVEPDGQVRLIDLGCARSRYQGRLARTTAMVHGSLKYMSTERLHSQRAELEDDLFALGVVLGDLLGAQAELPPQRDQAAHGELLRRLQTGCAPVLNELGELGTSIEELMLSLLAFEPEARPALQELLGALERLLEEAPGPGLEGLVSRQTPAPCEPPRRMLLHRFTPAPGSTMSSWSASPPPRPSLWRTVALWTLTTPLVLLLAGGGGWLLGEQLRGGPVDRASEVAASASNEATVPLRDTGLEVGVEAEALDTGNEIELPNGRVEAPAARPVKRSGRPRHNPAQTKPEVRASASAPESTPTRAETPRRRTPPVSRTRAPLVVSATEADAPALGCGSACSPRPRERRRATLVVE